MSTSNFEGWAKDEAGNITTNPLTGWDMLSVMDGMAAIVRLEFALDPSAEKRDAVQLIATAPQVREWSQALAQLADRLETQLAAMPRPNQKN